MYRLILLTLLTLILGSCSSSNVKVLNGADSIKTVESSTKKSVVESKFPVVAEVFNGKVKYVEFNIDENNGTYNLNCKEIGSKNPLIQNFPFIVSNNTASLYYVESYFSSAKSHECMFKDKTVLSILVKSFPYKSEQLNVDQRKVVLSEKDLARVIKEREITSNLYKNSSKQLLIDGPFSVPLDSFITSHYGNKRVFNNLKSSQHLGNDFRAKVGVPIPSSNRGKVVFVGNLFYTGNVVIVDHGLNIFSLYAHLSKMLVKAGDIINRNDIVGLSGKTGRVSGPHLHWGIKINSHNIDGFSLVEESKNQYLRNE